jgi:protein-disulfide isomerase
MALPCRRTPVRRFRELLSLVFSFAAFAAPVVLLISILLLTGSAASAADAGANSILATVGDHRITRQEVDDKVLHSVNPSELYDLRKQTLDSMIDGYVVDQAATKAGLSPDEFLKRELKSGGERKVTEADARKFYDTHKAQIQGGAAGRSFDQIKAALVAALQRQQDKERREAVIAKLRAQNHVEIALKAPRAAVVSNGRPWTGGKDAAVTVVEFSDFQCPYCKAAENSIKAVREKYGNRVKLVYMDFPLGFHGHAMDAARAAQCAAGQNKFWQYHDALFADQSKLKPADLKAVAAKLGLNTAAFNTCFDKNEPDAGIRQEMTQGQSLGITGTPTFFINGREIVGAQPVPKLEEVIDDELAAAKAPANQHEAKAD